MSKAQQKPKILNVKTVASSRMFRIQSVDLTFSNGESRVYERLLPEGRQAVMIVPVINDDILLIREYAVAIEDYELGFPKGLVEQDEDILVAANRELMEEIGYGARKLTVLSQLTLAPSYFASTMTIVLAEDLYINKLEGDEPEPLTLVAWPQEKMMELLADPDFNEARNVSALFLTREHLNQRAGSEL
ncbi:ADP compounds hydrolase NudE [Pragia fontium]|uniref:ADP-ribose diphosphatase n=2 Tax=Pragia fontium TaxID=82985 RepID=A0AAJ4WCN1_9GAMM|nr:ADP compounds hydrolase NudE [Pragia fontium]AKJ40894.1 adenosine nucleotide hydrolase [Pragia fontium]GKX64571.1 ADP compounds hydrolase NudE [Pragia fontium]SFD24819.1 ADP-ribose diphosphatase [Pragia fontium DSM 5563 = ATCC 49100]VEJ53012.1 ADP compounds hydrolase nudE [Pragia fontium]